MRRSIYLAVFVVLSGLAGFFYYAHTKEAAALTATHNLSVGTRIQDGDVTVRLVNPSSLSYAVLTTPDQAIGQIVSFPVLEGQFIDARQVAPSRNASLLGAGLTIPTGYRIIGLPVAPAAAVGGVLKAGDRVDVMAIPNPSKSAISVDAAPAAPVTIGADVLVLGLRTDQGSPIDQTDHSISASSDKAASVLLAIPQTDEATYSAAIASSTFFLALSTD